MRDAKMRFFFDPLGGIPARQALGLTLRQAKLKSTLLSDANAAEKVFHERVD
jgi:hypothetical protein